MGMKRRYLAVLMGVMVATTSVPAMVYAEDVKTSVQRMRLLTKVVRRLMAVMRMHRVMKLRRMWFLVR